MEEVEASRWRMVFLGEESVWKWCRSGETLRIEVDGVKSGFE